MNLKKIKDIFFVLSIIQSGLLLGLLTLSLQIQDIKEEILELGKYIIIDDATNEYYHNAGCTDMLLVLNMSLNSTTKELYEECKIK